MTDFSNKFQGYLDNIIKKDQDVKRYLALIDAEYSQSLGDELKALTLEEQNSHQHLRGVLADIQKPIDRIEKTLGDMRDDLSDVKRTQILHWLSPIPYTQHHNQARREVLAGTGHWFMNDERLLNWRRSSCSSIMWLRGLAGSGKSKLM